MAGREKKSNIVKLNSSPASPLYETFLLDDTESHPPLFDSVAYICAKANAGRPTISGRHIIRIRQTSASTHSQQLNKQEKVLTTVQIKFQFRLF